MTPEDLAAIRARDAAADRCLTCGQRAYTDDPYHQLTAEQCTAERGRRGPCADPGIHHPYAPGGVRDDLCPEEDAAADRRALLAEVDRLTAQHVSCCEQNVDAERARIRAAVEGLPTTQWTYTFDALAGRPVVMVDRAAVLAAIDGDA